MKVFTWKQRIVVIGVTVLMIALFGAIGYAIGLALDNWKLGIAIGALVSYPFTQFTLVRAVNRLYKHENKQEEKDQK